MFASSPLTKNLDVVGRDQSCGLTIKAGQQPAANPGLQLYKPQNGTDFRNVEEKTSAVHMGRQSFLSVYVIKDNTNNGLLPPLPHILSLISSLTQMIEMRKYYSRRCVDEVA